MKEYNSVPVIARVKAFDPLKLYDLLINMMIVPDRQVDIIKLSSSLFMLLDSCEQSILVFINAFNLWATENHKDQNNIIISSDIRYWEPKLMSLGCDIGHYIGRMWAYGAEFMNELIIIRTSLPHTYQRTIINLNSETRMDLTGLEPGRAIGVSMIDDRASLIRKIVEYVPLILSIPNSDITTEYANYLEDIGYHTSAFIVALKHIYETVDSEELDIDQVILRLDGVLFWLSKMSAAIARFSPVSYQLWGTYYRHHDAL